MSPKVLSDSGRSLADIYDVEGSIAGIDQLRSEEVALTHEMGTSILSERMASTIHFIDDVGALAQNTNFGFRYVFLPNTIARLVNISVCVIAAEFGRIEQAQVSIETIDPSAAVPVREIPIWIWTRVNDVESDARWSQEGAAPADFSFLRPSEGRGSELPYLTVGTLSRFSAAMIQFRGRTAAFGAGTVSPLLQLHVHFPLLAGVSSFGLPVPSW